MENIKTNLTEPVRKWLADFEKAISIPNFQLAEILFLRDSYWRDLLAFTWHIQTFKGGKNIIKALENFVENTKPTHFNVDLMRTPPRLVTRAGIEVIEALFDFNTAYGHANGVLRLNSDNTNDDTLKAWTLLTALNEIKGFEEVAPDAQPKGKTYAKDFRGPNWFDDRQSAVTYADREPTVLVVGGGQAGLSIGARLTELNVDTLIVDREQRVGDNWRNRYHALSLHNQVHVNHLPYMPFPRNWPTYIPKDKLAGWFEAYKDSMELNFWTETEFSGGTYNNQTSKWSVNLQLAGGKRRKIHPRHIIMATGVSGIPNLPKIKGLNSFGGKVIHSSEYKNGSDWVDKNVLIIGTGTSGHDISQDLFSNGANVTLVQRSPTMIVSVEPSAQLPYALYDEGLPLEDCDLIAASMPFQLLRTSHQLITEQIKLIDKELLDGLSRVGFKLDFGNDNSGWQFKYLERGGGYYFNVGCSDLIIEGKIRLVQFSDIKGFTTEGARTSSGGILPADLIIFATGFKGQDYLIRDLFGDDVANRVGPIWGFDGEQHELRNMFIRTGQTGLWFIAGSFAQCRIYSKFLGLQIKACEEGIIPLK